MSKSRLQSVIGEITYGPRASVTWKINDFFELPQKVDFCLESHTFNFIDASWCLRAYTYGESEFLTEGWLSLYLVKKYSITPKHQIYFRIVIRKHDGSEIEPWNFDDDDTSDEDSINTSDEDGINTFDEDDSDIGYLQFLKLSDLNEEKKNEVVPAGVLTVVCTVSLNRFVDVKAGVQPEALPGVEKLLHDFNNLLLSKDAADITLTVKNQEYKAHRAILAARSTVFSAMLRNDMKEKNSSIVEISDCDPNAFQQFLMYLYSGSVESISVDNACALHNIAHKYDVKELEKSCVQFMMNNISLEIFCDVLSLSLKYSESELLKKTVEFFAKNMGNILITTKWLSFVKENPVESNELHIKAVKYYAKHGFNACLQEQHEFSDKEKD